MVFNPPSGFAVTVPLPVKPDPVRLERQPASPTCPVKTAHSRCLLQDGHIALHLAVRRCQMEVIQTLISQGSSVDFQDRHGNTPLHVACKDGNVPIVVALCEANCNLDLSNKVKLEGRSLHSLCVYLLLGLGKFLSSLFKVSIAFMDLFFFIGLATLSVFCI